MIIDNTFEDIPAYIIIMTVHSTSVLDHAFELHKWHTRGMEEMTKQSAPLTTLLSGNDNGDDNNEEGDAPSE